MQKKRKGKIREAFARAKERLFHKPKSEKLKLSTEEQERLCSNIFAAVSRGSNREIKQLLILGADIATKRNGWTLLQLAASSGYTETCALLLEEYAKAGGDIKKFITAKDSTGWTAMYCATKNRYTETTQFLTVKLFEEIFGKETASSFIKSFSECIA